MGANISEIIIYYTMKKIEAEEYEESQRRIKLIKEKSQYSETVNPLIHSNNVK